MNITLNLPVHIATWAQAQPNAEAAILAVLEAQLSPAYRAASQLKQNVAKLPEGMEFEIPQIIGRELWDTLDRSARLSLGKYVKANSAEFGLEFLRKSPSNHAIYRRRL